MEPSFFCGIVLGGFSLCLWGWYFWTERFDFEFFRRSKGGKWFLLKEDSRPPYWAPLEKISWSEIYTLGNKRGRFKIVKEESWRRNVRT
jgi:hypothetical protein